MSAIPQTNSRTQARALAVGGAQGVRLQGFTVEAAGDPYAAMVEICRRPLVYRALVIGLQGGYQEELSVLSATKRRFPHVGVYVAQGGGRRGAGEEAMRLGADGVVTEHGVDKPVKMKAVVEAPV